MNRFHLLEGSERVAFGDELGDRTLVKSTSDQKDDIVDHVGIPDDTKRKRKVSGFIFSMSVTSNLVSVILELLCIGYYPFDVTDLLRLV